jgi:ATP-binding cassette subfamily B protein
MLSLFCAKLANSIFVDLTSYKNLMISKNKILGVMDEPEETGSTAPLITKTHEITFQNVDFSYVPGEPVLKDASFIVPDQKLTAIVGDSGSGKSTILNLISKYYEVGSGTICIGGKVINRVAAEQVLEQISMVDQDVFLFDDTIRENIRHARPDATDEEIEAACREANCDSFIRKMEKGYDTPTGENGNLLSGGERQRLSIARAILKNSPILLLDEATASLDIENELAVKQAIANLLKDKKTVVMIAHTLSIVKHADQILVVSDGRIAEAGTHDELLAKNGKYAAMWNAEQRISA